MEGSGRDRNGEGEGEKSLDNISSILLLIHFEGKA